MKRKNNEINKQKFLKMQKVVKDLNEEYELVKKEHSISPLIITQVIDKQRNDKIEIILDQCINSNAFKGVSILLKDEFLDLNDEEKIKKVKDFNEEDIENVICDIFSAIYLVNYFKLAMIGQVKKMKDKEIEIIQKIS